MFELAKVRITEIRILEVLFGDFQGTRQFCSSWQMFEFRDSNYKGFLLEDFQGT